MPPIFGCLGGATEGLTCNGLNNWFGGHHTRQRDAFGSDEH